MGTEAEIWTPGGEQGPAGPPGPAGPNIELRTNSTHVQWRVEGDTTWIDLILLSDLEGPQGTQGVAGVTGVTGPVGPEGPAIELQTTATHIQWRVVGDVTWINLVALSDITGPDGTNSTILRDTGAPGDATDGSDGDYYIQEDEPDFGVVLFGPKSGGAWPNNFVILTGPEGPPSEKVVLNGSGAPADSVGTNGDFYIDTDVYDIYGPKAGGAWPAGVSLIGPASELDELTDVDLATEAPVAGDILVFDGTNWVPENTPYPDYGELDITQNTTALSLTAATDSTLYTNSDYIQVTGIWDATPHGENRGVTQQTDTITINKDGVYKIEVWLNLSSDTSKTRVAIKFAANGVIGLGRRPTTLVNAAAESAQLAAHGLHSSTSGDVLSLHIAADKSADITIEDCVLSVNEMPQ